MKRLRSLIIVAVLLAFSILLCGYTGSGTFCTTNNATFDYDFSIKKDGEVIEYSQKSGSSGMNIYYYYVGLDSSDSITLDLDFNYEITSNAEDIVLPINIDVERYSSGEDDGSFEYVPDTPTCSGVTGESSGQLTLNKKSIGLTYAVNFKSSSNDTLSVSTSNESIYITSHLYVVEFDLNGGSFPETAEVETQCFDSDGNKATEPKDSYTGEILVPEKEGYEFLGWYSDPGLTSKYDFDNTVIDHSIVLYAKYGEIVKDYDWNDDYSECKGTAKCDEGTTDVEETAKLGEESAPKVVYTKTSDANCVDDEYGTYVATFSSELLEEQTVENKLGPTGTGRKHVDELTLHNGLAPTYDSAGYKKYYECPTCNKYYEDSDASILIGGIDNLNAWKAEGGNGYIPKKARPTGYIAPLTEVR